MFSHKMLRLMLLSAMLFFSPKTEARDSCQVGLFITDLYDLSLTDNSFSVNFWIWANYKNDSLLMLENLEIYNAKSYEYTMATIEEREWLNYGAQKANAVIKKNWDVRNFPLDRQELEIIIESGDLDSSNLIFSADIKNSMLDDRINLEGWRIDTMTVNSGISTYKTNYGDPFIEGTNSFATFTAKIVMQRDGWGLFTKIFSGLYVAFAISLLVFFLGIDNGERIGLLVGGLFAAVANKYIVDSILPQTTSYTLVDKIHAFTFFIILMELIVTVVVYRLSLKDKISMAKKIDQISFWMVLLSYFLYNIYEIGKAMTA